MGLFDKLFRKNQPAGNLQELLLTGPSELQIAEKIISTGDRQGFKIIRPLTDAQKAQLQQSTILLRTGQLYMHYWTDNLTTTDRNDQDWQNKVMFFWKAAEPFPKKSLPAVFETYKIKRFLFAGDTGKISLQVGQAAPWFGMPGLGEKHVCEMAGEKLTIPELHKMNLVEYVEPVELNDDNLHILTDREKYYFLVDERITPFANGSFQLEGKPVSIDIAYSIGGIHIIRITGSR